ncbi:MAG TPA: FtsX-like permease family protein [Thermoanaerobaculia bacterium]|nr:FtsX-like permease family protein [Thermoanaerobaculia bacterium]
MLRNALFLALRYLRSAPGRTAVLIAGTTVALFLPLFTWRAAALLERTLLLRAERSPILIGAKGNEFDLTLSSLYFRGQVREPIGARELDRVRRAGYGLCVPLYVAHSAGRAPIVGTGLEYFEARGLEPSSGRLPALLGEVVAGAEVADRMRLSVGDAVRSDLQNLYNISGGYPLLLDVVGILAPSGGPDDEAFFADVKTAWALDGLFHGHSEVTREQAIDPQAAADENVEATTALFLFQEIDDTNRDSFHMHGDPGAAPLTSILVLPRDRKAHDLLLGDYALEQSVQAVQPIDVVRTVLGIVLRAREGLNAFFVIVALSTSAFFVLVISLSLRLRAREIALMRRIGSSRGAVATIVGAEIALVVAVAVALSGALTWGLLAVLARQLGA